MIVILIIAGIFLAGVLLQIKGQAINSVNLEQLLPIWKVENDCVLSKNGDITIAFLVQLPEIFSLSNDEYFQVHQNWLKAIKILPVDSVLHKQDWFLKSGFHPDFTEKEGNFLHQSSNRFFNEHPYLDHHCYLMITLKAPARKTASSAYSNLLRSHIVPPLSTDPKRIQLLLDSVDQFKHILLTGGFIDMKRLNTDDLIGNEDTPGLLERYLFLLNANSGDKAAIKDIQFKPEWKVGESHLQLYTLADTENLPASCSPRANYEKYSTDKTKFSIGFASPVGQLLPVNHIYNQFLVIGDTSKTLKKMEAKRRRLHSLSAYSRENTISSEATSEFLNEAISQSRQPIRAHFNLLCWTDKIEAQKELRSITSSAISQMDVRPKIETVGAPQIWWAGIPGNAADLPENETFDTFAQQASCFLNMETAYRSSNSSFGIRLGDRLTGVPVHVDISDEPMKGITTNRNKMVVGSTGSGKSMFMNHMLHSYVQQGAHCVVVDVGHSYEGLCKLVGGYYFTYSDDNPIKFNPFIIMPGEVMDTEKKESIKTLLVALWKQNDETFKRSEYVAISNALQSYYKYLEEHQELFPCFNTFYEFLQDHFTNELEADGVKDRDFDIHNFLFVLRPYYKNGEFDYLLNSNENLDVLHQPFVVFELDNVKDHPILFSVTTLIIMNLFVSKMRKLKGIRKVIVIEEAWKAVARAGMAEFIRYLYKTLRKHFGEAITVTQEIDDLLDSPIIKEAIINSSDCKILLDMKKFQNKFDRIQEVLGMTNKGRDLVLSLNKANDPGRKYREIYIELGNQIMKVYRYEPSVEEYYAFSTEETEKIKVQEYTQKYGDIRKALRALASEMAA